MQEDAILLVTQVALSEDHLNDVQSNLAAICGAALAAHVPQFW